MEPSSKNISTKPSFQLHIPTTNSNTNVSSYISPRSGSISKFINNSGVSRRDSSLKSSLSDRPFSPRDTKDNFTHSTQPTHSTHQEHNIHSPRNPLLLKPSHMPLSGFDIPLKSPSLSNQTKMPPSSSFSSLLPDTKMTRPLLSPRYQNVSSLADIMPSKLVQGISTAKVLPIIHSPRVISPLTSPLKSNTSYSYSNNSIFSSKNKYLQSLASPKSIGSVSSGASVPSLDIIFKNLDKALSLQVTQTKKSIYSSLDKLEKRIKSAESNMKYMYNQIIINCEKELHFADGLVNKELRSKILISQWISAFLSDTSSNQLDPITFAYTRFSLNICLSYADIDPIYFLQSKVHEHLISYTQSELDIVIGPAIMALVHLSLLPVMKEPIVSSGILLSLLKILIQSDSKLILGQGCKLIASLALHYPNKLAIVNSGCFHAVVDLILGTGKRGIGPVKHEKLNQYDATKVPHSIQYYALTAATNIINGSDSNRVLALELKTVYPAIYAMNHTNRSDVISTAAKLLANIAYNNPFAGSMVLANGGEQAVLSAILSTDYLSEPEVCLYCLTEIGNLCSSEANQSHIGAEIRLVDMIIRIADHSKHILLVTEAAKAMLALSWKHISNKARIASQGGCVVLLKRIIYYNNQINRLMAIDPNSSEVELETICMEYLSAALASILLNTWTQHKLIEVNGVEEIVKIVKSTTLDRVMCSLSMIIVAMVPSPEELLRYHTEAHITPVEKVNSLSVLKKVRVIGFGHLPHPPEWLEIAVQVLSKTDAALSQSKPWVKSEFVDNIVFYSECISEILPDSHILNNNQLKGFLFSLC